MTIVKRFPTHIAHTAAASVPHTVDTTAPRHYGRILVLLDNMHAAEEAIRTGSNLAREHGASMVMVIQSQPGAHEYIDRTCRAFEEDETVSVHGYTITSAIADLPNWLLNSEKADAIIVAQKPTGWLERFVSGDFVASLQARTGVDVFTVR
ncbi:MAG: hypothetical protein AAFV33_14835 [Chloroflexota bacterium]